MATTGLGFAQEPKVATVYRGYDHGYYFISTFVADHLAHHAKVFGAMEGQITTTS
jgi:S-formylglutathione hydrolase